MIERVNYPQIRGMLGQMQESDELTNLITKIKLVESQYYKMYFRDIFKAMQEFPELHMSDDNVGSSLLELETRYCAHYLNSLEDEEKEWMELTAYMSSLFIYQRRKTLNGFFHELCELEYRKIIDSFKEICESDLPINEPYVRLQIKNILPDINRKFTDGLITLNEALEEYKKDLTEIVKLSI